MFLPYKHTSARDSWELKLLELGARTSVEKCSNCEPKKFGWLVIGAVVTFLQGRTGKTATVRP